MDWEITSHRLGPFLGSNSQSGHDIVCYMYIILHCPCMYVDIINICIIILPDSVSRVYSWEVNAGVNLIVGSG